MEDDEEKSFCYIEGSVIDKNAAEEVSELHENVWYRMKPPKPQCTMYSPFVSARQIDLIRNILLGKNTLKPAEIKIDDICQEKPCSSSTPRRDVIEQPSLKQRKSSVRFLQDLALE